MKYYIHAFFIHIINGSLTQNATLICCEIYMSMQAHAHTHTCMHKHALKQIKQLLILHWHYSGMYSLCGACLGRWGEAKGDLSHPHDGSGQTGPASPVSGSRPGRTPFHAILVFHWNTHSWHVESILSCLFHQRHQ